MEKCHKLERIGILNFNAIESCSYENTVNLAVMTASQIAFQLIISVLQSVSTSV